MAGFEGDVATFDGAGDHPHRLAGIGNRLEADDLHREHGSGPGSQLGGLVLGVLSTADHVARLLGKIVECRRRM